MVSLQKTDFTLDFHWRLNAKLFKERCYWKSKIYYYLNLFEVNGLGKPEMLLTALWEGGPLMSSNPKEGHP